MSRHSRLKKTMRSPARQNRRRRHRPAAERPQAYKQAILSSAALAAIFARGK